MKPPRIALCLACLAPLPAAAEDGIVWQPMLFFDAVLYGDNQDGRGSYLVGESVGLHNAHAGGGHSHGNDLQRGLNARYAEATLAMRTPSGFDGRASVLFVPDEGTLELHEAWLRTPDHAGVRLRAGRFFSAFSPTNALHPHQWDFVDAPLPYQLLLDGKLVQDGVQAVWHLPTAWPARVGAEIARSRNLGMASQFGGPTVASNGAVVQFADAHGAPNVGVAYAAVSPLHSPAVRLEIGAAHVYSAQHQELHEPHPGVNSALHGLEGQARLNAAHLDYCRCGQNGVGELRLRGDYLFQNKDMRLTYHQLQPPLVGQPRDLYEDAWALQAVYGFAPRWNAGLRYERVGDLHDALRTGATVGPTHTSTLPKTTRWSAQLTRHLPAQQKLRLQVSLTDSPQGVATLSGGQLEKVQIAQAYVQYEIGFGH